MEALKMSFGEYCRKLRLDRRITLREFCQSQRYDIGNISGIESGRYPVPTDHEYIVHYAQSLDLEEGSDEWILLFDLWSKESKDRAHHVSPSIMDQLPVLFRTVDNREPDDEVLDGIIRKLGGTA